MKKIIVSLLLMGGVAGSALAQQANKELKNLINQSFGYFPKLQELEQAVQVNEQRAGLTALSTKPTISASGSYTYLAPVPTIPFPDGNGNSKDFKLQPNHNLNTGVSILEPLYDFGRTRLAMERAKLDVQQAKNNVEYNKAQLAAQVAQVYYTITYLQKAIAVQDSVISVLQANKQLMADKYKNGDALKMDVLTMQNNIDIEQNRQSDLQNQLQKQFTLLQYATGQTVRPAGKFDFTVGAVDSLSALQAAQVNNYDFIMAQQRIRQAEADVAISQLANKPTITLNGSTGFRNGFQPDISEFKWNYAVGVGVSVPIFNGGRDKMQTQIAQSIVRQNQLAVESLNNQYSRDIRQALTDVQTYRERWQTTEEQIAIAKEALRVAQSRYKNGISTNVELLNANTNLQKVELAQIQYQYQLTLSQIELARLMGVKYW